MNCTVCDNEGSSTMFIKNNFPIVECNRCKHAFTAYIPTPEKIREIYSDDYFFKGGTGYANYILEKNMLIKRGEYYARKVSNLVMGGNMLDVGAAAGFILKGFENKGWHGMGIEPNKSMVDFARKEVEVNVQQGTLETMDTEEKFDLISIIQVMAHLYNLNKSLKRINFFLKPKGYVLIETWDKDSVTAKLFGKHWHEYSPPATLNYFSRKSLERLMNKHKFKLVKQGTPRKSINSSHAKSLIQHKLSESKSLRLLKPFTYLIPGNLILPYPSEDLFWALYQKK